MTPKEKQELEAAILNVESGLSVMKRLNAKYSGVGQRSGKVSVSADITKQLHKRYNKKKAA